MDLTQSRQPAAGTPAEEPNLRGSYRDILLREMMHGLTELQRSAGGLLLSGISAGLDIGFSVLLMAVLLTTTAGGQLPEPLIHLLLANMYAVGFILVVHGRSELFTEHTTVAVFPVLTHSAPLRRLLRLWGLVYVANLVGAAIFSALTVLIGPRLGIIRPAAFAEIALPLVGHPWWIVAMSAVLAGWMMGLMSWLVAATRETLGQIFSIWLIAASIGFARLHHCIVGSVEVLCAVFAGEGVSAADYAHFLLWTTLGNAIGGTVFVALLKFTHVRYPGVEPRAQDVELDVDGASR